MSNSIRFVHINLIAKNWQKLAQFYIEVFGCIPQYPERDLSGEWIDRMTKIREVKIRGIHLALPGFKEGPTLEIFDYSKTSETPDLPKINDPGFGHIAFHVANVEETLEKILANGGSCYGELIEKEIEGVGKLKAVYARDPEGNIVEVQNWIKD